MLKLLIRNILRKPLGEVPPAAGEDDRLALAGQTAAAVRRRLGRSLAIRAVDAGSCNGCELEMHALSNAYYDLDRFGFHFVASPRHADLLLVTGPVTRNMEEALRRTHDATPGPKWVVAAGDCARDGGCFRGSYAVLGGVGAVLPVDLYLEGCPPRPETFLKGLIALMKTPPGTAPDASAATRRAGALNRRHAR